MKTDVWARGVLTDLTVMVVLAAVYAAWIWWTTGAV